ncbi:MAG: hypothetical protein U1E11_00895 [Dethiobacteria bacterium]|nr:hypothetical protein [Dethiobacteria bacterium]
MHILIVILYILGSLLALAAALVAFMLIVPLRYRVEGGYETGFLVNYNLRWSPAFIFKGEWDEGNSENRQPMVLFFGIPLVIKPKKLKPEKEHDEDKDKDKKKSFPSILTILDKSLRTRGLKLINDLLQILKPDQVEISGKVGFDEPHLTGWLAAVSSSLHYCCRKTWISIEPVWEDECYGLHFLIDGRLRLGLMLVKVGWFYWFTSWVSFPEERAKGKYLLQPDGAGSQHNLSALNATFLDKYCIRY